MPVIEEAELNWNNLMRNKAEQLVLRRQENIKDQSLECSIGNHF